MKPGFASLQKKKKKNTASLPKSCRIMCYNLMRPKFVAIMPEDMVKYGASASCFWGCFSSAQTLIRVEGKISGSKFWLICVQNLRPSARKLMRKRNFSFQQNNPETHLQINRELASPKEDQSFGTTLSRSKFNLASVA